MIRSVHCSTSTAMRAIGRSRTAALLLHATSPAHFVPATCGEGFVEGLTERLREIEDFPKSPTTSSTSLAGDDQIRKKRPLGILLDFIENAKIVSIQTGRADYADGLARSFELLFGLQSSADARVNVVSQLIDDLEDKLQIAENNLGQAVLGAPIHGDFAALR